MREFFILVKYTMKNRGRKKSGFSISTTPVLPLIFIIGFSIPMGVLFYHMFTKLSFPLPGIIPDGFFLMDFLAGLSFAFFSLLFFLSYSPMIVFTLFENETTPFLLSLPIKKINIFLLASIDALIVSGIPIWYLLAMPLVYSRILGINPFVPYLTFLFFFLLLIAISNLAGMLLSMFISRTGAKYLGMVFYFVAILIFFILMNSPLIRANPSDVQAMVTKFKKVVNLVLSPTLPFRWVIIGMKGRISGCTFLGILSTAVSLVILRISYYIDFQVGRRVRRKRAQHSTFSYPSFRKELLILKREPRIVFLIIYSLLFPIILYFGSSGNEFSILMMAVALGGFYAPFITTILLAQERKTCPLPLSFPIPLEKLLIPKAIIPAIFYFFIFLLLGIPASVKSIISLPFVFILPIIIFFNSMLSILLIVRSPERDWSKKNVFRFTETIILEGLTIVLAVLIYLVGGLYLSEISGYVEIEKIHHLRLSYPFYFHTLGAGIPLITLLGIIPGIKKITEDIKKLGRNLCN